MGQFCEMKIQVVVYDDNRDRRNGLKLLIDSRDDMVCTGAFPDCSRVLADLAAAPPDVVLMDIDMPKVNGIEGVRLIREHYPDMKILMQTVFEENEKIFASICAGADGYLLKKSSPTRILESIREVMEGGAPMTPSVAHQVLQLFSSQNRRAGKSTFDLSERELEILTLLTKGLSYKMIAVQCHISFSTVNTHVKHIYKKLHVNSAVEAVKKAIDERIV